MSNATKTFSSCKRTDGIETACSSSTDILVLAGPGLTPTLPKFLTQCCLLFKRIHPSCHPSTHIRIASQMHRWRCLCTALRFILRAPPSLSKKKYTHKKCQKHKQPNFMTCDPCCCGCAAALLCGLCSLRERHIIGYASSASSASFSLPPNLHTSASAALLLQQLSHGGSAVAFGGIMSGSIAHVGASFVVILFQLRLFFPLQFSFCSQPQNKGRFKNG